MKKTEKISKVLPIFVILLLAFATDQARADVDFGITSIGVSPTPLRSGENMTVTVVFYDTTNITDVQLLVCTITPNFVCESPVNMVEKETGIYEGAFLIEYQIDTVVGYHIKINYANATNIVIPEDSSFLDMDVIEPYPGIYYFNAGAVQLQTDETGYCGILGIFIAIGGAIMITKRKTKVS